MVIFGDNLLKDQSRRAPAEKSGSAAAAFRVNACRKTVASGSECVGCYSYHRLPAQQHFSLADVGSPPLGVVLGLREELDLTAAHCVQVKSGQTALIQSEKRGEIAPIMEK